MRIAGTFDPQPDEVVHHRSRTATTWRRSKVPVMDGDAADVVKIVDSLDNTNPGFHPLLGRPRPN